MIHRFQIFYFQLRTIVSQSKWLYVQIDQSSRSVVELPVCKLSSNHNQLKITCYVQIWTGLIHESSCGWIFRVPCITYGQHWDPKSDVRETNYLLNTG